MPKHLFTYRGFPFIYLTVSWQMDNRCVQTSALWAKRGYLTVKRLEIFWELKNGNTCINSSQR